MLVTASEPSSMAAHSQEVRRDGWQPATANRYRVTVGTTIRTSRLRYPSCVSQRARDLRFLRTVGDR
jgi:hypothetical protein